MFEVKKFKVTVKAKPAVTIWNLLGLARLMTQGLLPVRNSLSGVPSFKYIFPTLSFT